MKKSIVFLILFCILYLFLMNFFNDFELGHDQSRHANSGALWYYYFHGYGEKEFSSFDEFLVSFPEFSRGKIGWYFVFDPPVHGLLTAVSYLFFGMNEFAARLPSQLLQLLGMVFLFFLAKAFLSERNALLVTVLYVLTPFIFHLARDAMTDTAAITFIIAWMYCTFYWAQKKEGWKIYLCWTLGALFLTAGALTKYPVFFFFAVFMMVYFLFLTIQSYCKEKKWWTVQNRTLLCMGILQCSILFAVSWWWISYSWIDSGMFTVLTGVGSEDWTRFSTAYNVPYLLYELVMETVGFFLFTSILILRWRHMEAKHIPLLCYVLTALFILPFIFTNIQPRYYASLLPFGLILVVVALEKAFSQKAILRISVVYILLYLFIDVTMAYAVLQSNGVIDATAFDETFATFSGAAVFFNYYGNFDTVDMVSGPNVLTIKSWWTWMKQSIYENAASKQKHHYSNPDLFMFRMFQRLETHSEIGFTYLSSQELEGAYGEDILKVMNQTKTSFPTYFILANTKQGEEYQGMHEFLAGVNTERYAYPYWDFYRVK